MPSNLDRFEDIHITGADESLSHRPDPNKGLYDVYLTLSASPPVVWAQLFQQDWDTQFYSMRRRASVEGAYVVIRCAPEELNQHHLPRLKESVARSNARYREHLQHRARVAELETQREQSERDRLHRALNELDLG